MCGLAIPEISPHANSVGMGRADFDADRKWQRASSISKERLPIA